MGSRVYDLLVNWGRYWRDHGGDFTLPCYSLESRYRPEFDPDRSSLLAAESAQEERASKLAPPDMRDAILVNEAWKRCERDDRRLLKWSFCMGRLSDQTIANRCGFPIDALQLRYAKALRKIARILDTPDFIDRIALDNLRTSPAKDIPAQTENRAAPGAASVRAREPHEID